MEGKRLDGLRIVLVDDDADSLDILIARVRELPEEQGRHVPAVALTAHAYAEDRDRALRAGFQSYLSKPVEPDRVVDTVARLAAAVP